MVGESVTMAWSVVERVPPPDPTADPQRAACEALAEAEAAFCWQAGQGR